MDGTENLVTKSSNSLLTISLYLVSSGNHAIVSAEDVPDNLI